MVKLVGVVTTVCLSSAAFASDSDRESCIKEHSKLFGLLFDERTISRCVQEHNDLKRIHLEQTYWNSADPSNESLSDDQFRSRISELKTDQGLVPSSANLSGDISSASGRPFTQTPAAK